MPSSKNELRAILLARPLPTAQPSLELLETLPAIATVTTVAAFISLPSEPSTLGLRAWLRTRGIRVLLPILEADNSLSWAADGGAFATGRLGLMTPTGPTTELALAELMIVPALAIGPHGERLGRGGGSYDRALAGWRAARPDGVVLAWVLDRDLRNDLPTEGHDEGVDAAVTESQLLVFDALG